MTAFSDGTPLEAHKPLDVMALAANRPCPSALVIPRRCRSRHRWLRVPYHRCNTIDVLKNKHNQSSVNRITQNPTELSAAWCQAALVGPRQRHRLAAVGQGYGACYQGRHLAVQRPGQPAADPVNANGSITGVQSGLRLDVTGGSTTAGMDLELWICSGQSNQKWILG
jgi:hypothetical protein